MKNNQNSKEEKFEKAISEINKLPQFMETLLSELEGYPILVVTPTENKNKVNISTIIKSFTNLFVSKIVMKNIDKNLAEDVISEHNSKI